MNQNITPFEAIRRTNPAGDEFWSSRDFAKVLGYVNYRRFEAVITKAKTACFNSGQRVEDHFVGSDQMVEIGSGAQRPLKTVMMSRYACYLVIQNADPAKEIVAQGQTYFAIQTRRQELSDAEVEEQRRLAIRSELRTHNSQLADAAKDAGVIEPRDYAIIIASTIRNASTFGFTSWTRWIITPASLARAVIATVGQARSARSGLRRTLPMKDFRETPSSKGRPPTPSSGSARSKARLCSTDFPKPIPGSKQIASGSIPAATSAASRSSKNPRTSATTSS
jgi:hypothetical protein